VASDLAPPIRPDLLAAILRGGRIGLHESLLVFVDGMADVEDVRLVGLSKSSLLVLFIGLESQIFGEVVLATLCQRQPVRWCVSLSVIVA